MYCNTNTTVIMSNEGLYLNDVSNSSDEESTRYLRKFNMDKKIITLLSASMTSKLTIVREYDLLVSVGVDDSISGLNKTEISTKKIISASGSLFGTMLIVYEDGEIYGKGGNYYGHLAIGNANDEIPTLTRLNIGVRIESVTCGFCFTIALDISGNTYSFGHNPCGQLGLGHKNDMHTPTSMNMKEIVAICAGSAHVLMVDCSYNVYAHGLNTDGQLGIDQVNNDSVTIPTIVCTGFEAISCGFNYSVILSINGKVSSCGNNDYGQLGLGHTYSTCTFTEINIDDPITSIACGINHTAIRNNKDEIFTFGRNDYAQLLLGDTNDRSTPTKIPITAVSDRMFKNANSLY